MAVNNSNCEVMTNVVYFHNTSHTELDARVTRLFERVTMWTRFQKGTTAMRKFIPRMRRVVATALKSQPKFEGDREFVLLYAVDRTFTLVDKVEHECFTLLPDSYKTQYFKVSFDLYVEDANKWMDNVRVTIAKDLAKLADGSVAFNSLSTYVQDQMKSFSIAPHVETVGFTNDEFAKMQHRRLCDLDLRVARPQILDWITGNLTLDVWRQMSLPKSSSDLIQGIRTIYFYGTNCEDSKNNFERMQAEHGSVWKAYCDVLENLSVQNRTKFAMNIVEKLHGKVSDRDVFEEMCHYFPEKTIQLSKLMAKPLDIFKEDVAFSSPDLFF